MICQNAYHTIIPNSNSPIKRRHGLRPELGSKAGLRVECLKSPLPRPEQVGRGTVHSSFCYGESSGETYSFELQ